MTIPSRPHTMRGRAEARLARMFPAPLAPSADATSGDEPDGFPERGIDTRAASVVALVAVLSIVLAVCLLWRARPQSADAGPVPSAALIESGSPVSQSFHDAAFTPDPTPTPTPIGEPDLVVDVQGRVRQPGVVTLPPGSRVRDAIDAAGGARTGVSTRSLNLAAPVADGEQVMLGASCVSGAPTAPMQAASAPPTATDRPSQAATPALIDLNRATVAELETLPGVGPVLARRIVEYRSTRGRFHSVDELREVSGIGPAKFAEIRSRVRV